MLNSTIFMGRLVSDPTIQTKQNGEKEQLWGRFRLAVNRDRTAKGQPTADYFNCVVFGSNASYAAKHLIAGSLIVVNGRMQSGSYDDKDGKRIYTCDLVVSTLYPASQSKEKEIAPERQMTPSQDGFTRIEDYEIPPFSSYDN